ncbi:hypothetical protein DPMN_155955 [Dreissena polymorpha]|uniref:Uncharacterized protein n=1 Tax=Dreissena polymorpha TaxID=45954 RepID=A0A9D4JBV0_DREPO|nr:hypothetical protein DPMN_155955 [Dreissena polymorpha]
MLTYPLPLTNHHKNSNIPHLKQCLQGYNLLIAILIEQHAFITNASELPYEYSAVQTLLYRSRPLQLTGRVCRCPALTTRRQGNAPLLQRIDVCGQRNKLHCSETSGDCVPYKVSLALGKQA